MASPGHYKAVQSSDPRLEVRQARVRHACAGVAVERGERPGRLQDVWMIGRSRRCVGTIKSNEYYVANRIVPQRTLGRLSVYEQYWSTCLACAIETYPEFFTGPEIAKYLPKVSAEKLDRIVRGLSTIHSEMSIIEDGQDAEAR